jgi:2-dehydro-3-deoxyphosphooctonate aldolase (KDO 8-P synthase)
VRLELSRADTIGGAKTLLGRQVGLNERLFFIAGPCAIENEELCLRVADRLKRLAEELDCLIIFKSSFDKANRTSGSSFRGPGMDEGLRILERVRASTGLPVLTDVHEREQVGAVASVVDVLQTPAFLARQSDLIAAVAASGRPVNIKKAQFMAPGDMAQVIKKARAAASAAGVSDEGLMVCERGTSFGYHNLVVDMRGLATMAGTGCPVVFDATHSVQLPGGLGESSGGDRTFVPVLARAAVAAGVAGVFMETHPDPANALSDGPNAWPLDALPALMRSLIAINEARQAAS